MCIQTPHVLFPSPCMASFFLAFVNIFLGASLSVPSPQVTQGSAATSFLVPLGPTRSWVSTLIDRLAPNLASLLSDPLFPNL